MGFSLEWERITVYRQWICYSSREIPNRQFSIANFRWKIDDGESVPRDRVRLDE